MAVQLLPPSRLSENVPVVIVIAVAVVAIVAIAITVKMSRLGYPKGYTGPTLDTECLLGVHSRSRWVA